MLPGTGQGLSHSLSKRAFPAGPLMAPLSLTPGNCWLVMQVVVTSCKLSGVVSSRLEVSFTPGQYRRQDQFLLATGQGVAPAPLARAAGGRMWLQSIAMVTGTFLILPQVFNHCSVQCTTKQLSARHWDFRPLLMFSRTGRMKSVPQEGAGRRGGVSLLLGQNHTNEGT